MWPPYNSGQPSVTTQQSKEASVADLLQTMLAPASNDPTPFNSYQYGTTSMRRGKYVDETVLDRNKKSPVLVDWGTHNNQFVDKWNSDARWRTDLVRYGSATGYLAKNAGASDYLRLWQYAGQLSSDWAKNGRYYTPMEVLKFLAGRGGAGGGIPGFGSGSGGGSRSTSSNVSYDISDAKTATAITNAVMAAALGREATPEELAKYKAALNAYEKANPSRSSGVSTSDGNGNSRSSSTSTSGATAAGRQQLLAEKMGATAEGQAFKTQNIFNEALNILAGM